MKKFILFIFIILGQQILNANDNYTVSNSKPEFNSLAEEAAYKRQQEAKVSSLNEEKKTFSEEEFYKEYDEYYLSWANLLEKYAVKKTEPLSSIDMKYKDREQLFQAKLKDLEKLKLKAIALQDSKYNSYRDSNKFKTKYALSEITKIEEPYIMYIMGFGTFESTTTIEQYKSYLRNAYETYEDRQASIYKKIEDEKKDNERKTKLYEQEKLERDKFRSACQSWLNKARQDVLSLGVGEEVVTIKNEKAVSRYTINKVEKNTFLVGTYTLLNTYEKYYVQKTDCIPFKAIQIAPSPYCYK